MTKRWFNGTRNSRTCASGLALTLLGYSLLFSATPSYADAREFAEDLAAALCGAIGAQSGGNSAAAAGTVVCKYATRAADTAVKALIDKYFEGKDQEFADRTCTTIMYKDGKVIRPSPSSGCSN